MKFKIFSNIYAYLIFLGLNHMMHAQDNSAKLLLKIEAAHKNLFHKNAFINDSIYQIFPAFDYLKSIIQAKDTDLVKEILEKGTVFNFDLKAALKQTHQEFRSISMMDFWDLEADSLVLNKCEQAVWDLNVTFERRIWDLILDSTIDVSTNKEYKSLTRKQNALYKKKCYKSLQSKIFTSAKWLVTFTPILIYNNYVLVYFGYRKKVGSNDEIVKILRFDPS